MTFSLFLCLFAAQSAVIAMAPVLADAAVDLDVSTSTAGQLRTITGLAAGTTALCLGAVSRRLSLKQQLISAAALLAAAAGASALAPSYTALAIAQVPLGVAIAVLTTASVVAAVEWSDPAARTAAVSWALTGQPAAWIAGMPILGIVGERSWRLGWLVLPAAAGFAAALAVGMRRVRAQSTMSGDGIRTALADRAARRWLVSEFFANAAWSGTLVYAGALFAETYDISPRSTGLVLAVAATAYVLGNLVARSAARQPSHGTLAMLAVLLSVSVSAFGLERRSVLLSALLFSTSAVFAGARTLVATAVGLNVPSERRASLASLRAATMQFGYFIGAGIGGLALTESGYGAVGIVMSMLFALAAAVLSTTRLAHRAQSDPCCAPA